VATSWDPKANWAVNGLAVSGGTVYAGGTFTGIGGQTRSGIAALDAATGAATSWDPNPNGPPGQGTVSAAAMALIGGTVYAGGNFASIGGQIRNGVAALDVSTGMATGWNPNLGGRVNALVVSGGM